MTTRRNEFLQREDRDLTASITGLLEREIDRGEIPSAAWCVVRRDRIVSRGAVGSAVVEPRRIEARPNTVYDLASLTKPLVTTTLVLLAVAEERLTLDAPVSAVVPELRERDELAELTWVDLLAHRGGIEAWYPLYVEGRDRFSYLRTILARPMAAEPRTTVIYSDLGFTILFIAIERLFGASLDRLASDKLFGPLELRSCCFNPSTSDRPGIAATEKGQRKEKEMVEAHGLSFLDWRDEVIWGEANDGNAWYLGGVAGHAGLFGDAPDVAKLAAVYLGRGDLLPDELRRRAFDCQASGNDERRGLGWQLRGGAKHQAAPLGEASFGHTGFTGTSVWVDPSADLVVVLLTNRIHPRAGESRIQEIRLGVNELVARSI